MKHDVETELPAEVNFDANSTLHYFVQAILAYLAKPTAPGPEDKQDPTIYGAQIAFADEHIGNNFKEFNKVIEETNKELEPLGNFIKKPHQSLLNYLESKTSNVFKPLKLLVLKKLAIEGIQSIEIPQDQREQIVSIFDGKDKTEVEGIVDSLKETIRFEILRFTGTDEIKAAILEYIENPLNNESSGWVDISLSRTEAEETTTERRLKNNLSDVIEKAGEEWVDWHVRNHNKNMARRKYQAMKRLRPILQAENAKTRQIAFFDFLTQKGDWLQGKQHDHVRSLRRYVLQGIAIATKKPWTTITQKTFDVYFDDDDNLKWLIKVLSKEYRQRFPSEKETSQSFVLSQGAESPDQLGRKNRLSGSFLKLFRKSSDPSDFKESPALIEIKTAVFVFFIDNLTVSQRYVDVNTASIHKGLRSILKQAKIDWLNRSEKAAKFYRSKKRSNDADERLSGMLNANTAVEKEKALLKFLLGGGNSHKNSLKRFVVEGIAFAVKKSDWRSFADDLEGQEQQTQPCLSVVDQVRHYFEDHAEEIINAISQELIEKYPEIAEKFSLPSSPTTKKRTSLSNRNSNDEIQRALSQKPEKTESTVREVPVFVDSTAFEWSSESDSDSEKEARDAELAEAFQRLRN